MKKKLLILTILGFTATSLFADSLYIAKRNAVRAIKAERKVGYNVKSVAGRYLRYGHYRTYNRYLYRGNCYVFFGVGDNTITNLDAALFTRNFRLIGADIRRSKNTVIKFCPRRSGLYRIRTKVNGGHGYFFQVLGWK